MAQTQAEGGLPAESGLPAEAAPARTIASRAAASRVRRPIPALRHCPAEIWFALLAACVIAAASAYRYGAIEHAIYPGHADPAFYYNVAQNARAGRGLTVDYQWEFLSGQHPLPQYAFGYWLPMASVLMSVGLHFGSTLTAALAVGVSMAIVVAIAVYLLARAMTSVPWVPAAAAAVAIVQPSVSGYSVQSEAVIYLAAFGVLAIAAAVQARHYPWLWLVAGVVSALANLSRNEGLLLFVIVFIAAVASGARWRQCVLRGGGALIGYVVVMSPLFVADLRHFSSLMPPASGSFPYITTYENLFALHVPHTLSALLPGGFGQALRLRFVTLDNQISIAFGSADALGAVLLIALSGASIARRAGAASDGPVSDGPAGDSRTRRAAGAVLRVARAKWFVPAAFTVLMFVFYAAATPVVAGAGAVAKGTVTVLPVIIVAAMVGLAHARPRAVVVVAIMVALLGMPLLTMAQATRGTIARNNAVGRGQARMLPTLRAEQACLSTPLVLMTRNPWEFTEATHYASVMIPNDPLQAMIETAKRYHATDINTLSTRPQLGTPASLVRAGVLYQPPSLAGTSVYRIAATTAGARC